MFHDITDEPSRDVTITVDRIAEIKPNSVKCIIAGQAVHISPELSVELQDVEAGEEEVEITVPVWLLMKEGLEYLIDD